MVKSLKIILFQIMIVVLSVQVAAARLPVVGEDANEWGSLLNDFLLVSHTIDGFLKNLFVNGSQITFEGATDDDFNTVLEVTDPTEERTITFPDASGEVSVLGQSIDSNEFQDSELKLLSNGEIILAQGRPYGVLTVAPLSEDRYYTFPDMSGAVVLTDDERGAIVTTGGIILDSSSSDLWIRDNGEGYYGVFDVDYLSEDRYYTFPDASGTVVLVDDETGAITAAGGVIIDGSSSDLRIVDDSESYYGIFDVDSLSEDAYYTFPDLSGEVSILGQSIDSDEIEDYTITSDDISDGTITDDDIADGPITIGDGGTIINKIRFGTFITPAGTDQIAVVNDADATQPAAVSVSCNSDPGTTWRTIVDGTDDDGDLTTDFQVIFSDDPVDSVTCSYLLVQVNT